MHSGLVFTAALALTLMTAAAGSGAQAAKWCGTAAHAKSIIECGYSSESECEGALNKGGVCFIDPDYAKNGKGTAPSARVPANASEPSPARG
jgi:hypothetical protein